MRMNKVKPFHSIWEDEHAPDSILYKNAVGDYDSFMSTPVAVETLPYIKCYDIDTRNVLESSDYMPNIYRLLLREYRNSQINFTNIDDFLDMLWSVLENHVPNFIERYNQYQRILSMTDDDLLSLGTSITNIVENTNEKPTEPLKNPLPNVTNQQSSRTYSDKPSKIRSQIYISQMTIVQDFLSNFRWLFIRLNVSGQYVP